MTDLYESRSIIASSFDIPAMPFQIQRIVMAMLTYGHGTLKLSPERAKEIRLELIKFLEGPAQRLFSEVCAVRIQMNEGQLHVIVSQMDGFYAEMEVWSTKFSYGDPIQLATIQRRLLQSVAGGIWNCYLNDKSRLYRYVYVGKGSTRQMLKQTPRTEMVSDMMELGQWFTVILGAHDISTQPHVMLHDHGSWRIGEREVPPPSAKSPSHLRVIK